MLDVEGGGWVGVLLSVGVVDFFGALFEVFVHVRDFGYMGSLHGGLVPLRSGFIVVLL